MTLPSNLALHVDKSSIEEELIVVRNSVILKVHWVNETGWKK